MAKQKTLKQLEKEHKAACRKVTDRLVVAVHALEYHDVILTTELAAELAFKVLQSSRTD